MFGWFVKQQELIDTVDTEFIHFWYGGPKRKYLGFLFTSKEEALNLGLYIGITNGAL